MNFLRGRSSSFAPFEPGGLVSWYDAADETTIQDTAGTVTQLDDKGAFGIALQPTASGVTTGNATEDQNGNNVIELASDYLEGVSTFGAPASGVIFCAHNQKSVSGSAQAIFAMTSAGNDFQLDNNASDISTPRILSDIHTKIDTATNYTNTPVIRVYRYDTGSGDAAFYLDGGTVIGTQTYVGAYETSGCTHRIGANRGGSVFHIGNFFEFRWYNSDLPDASINAVGSALGDKWGITWTDI